MAAISETVSENTPSRKRGRPLVVPAELMANYANIWYHIASSRRGLQNKHYTIHAFAAIGDGKDPAFSWLADNKTKGFRQVILAELGRIEGADEIREIAKHICATKPRSKDAAMMIRRCRGKARTPGSLGLKFELLKAISKRIDDFSAAYADVDLETIRWALANAIDNIDGMIEDRDDAKTKRKKGGA